MLLDWFNDDDTLTGTPGDVRVVCRDMLGDDSQLGAERP
jgi:hypothetical protein